MIIGYSLVPTNLGKLMKPKPLVPRLRGDDGFVLVSAQYQHGFGRREEHGVAAAAGEEFYLGVGLALVGFKLKRKLTKSLERGRCRRSNGRRGCRRRSLAIQIRWIRVGQHRGPFERQTHGPHPKNQEDGAHSPRWPHGVPLTMHGCSHTIPRRLGLDVRVFIAHMRRTTSSLFS